MVTIMPLVGFCMLFMSGFYNVKHLSYIRNCVHQIIQPLCAPNKHNL